MEDQLQENNISGVWRGLKSISGYKESDSPVEGDQGWVQQGSTGLIRHLTLPQPSCSCCSLSHQTLFPPTPHIYTLSFTSSHLYLFY